MRVPCDACKTRLVDPKRDWMFLYENKITVCDSCAEVRFDKIYDRITFDWWEFDLILRREAIKRDQIARLGALSPTALIEERERIASSLRKRT